VSSATEPEAIGPADFSSTAEADLVYAATSLVLKFRDEVIALGIKYERDLRNEVAERSTMTTSTESTIAVAEKIASLVKRAPAGGIFHDAEVGVVAGIEVLGFGGMAGFTIVIDDVVYEVAIKRAT
jgi:hypothetical protein